MAKGNMLLGKSRGSVGDVTFSQINGQQIAKARNRNPANPRTLKQCFQRGRFAAAVKFYTRGTQALYKFAFENKRQTESDYNAFMRENVKIAPAISKAAFDNYDYPVIAPFIMSKGSLAPVINIQDGSGIDMLVSPAVAGQQLTTIGDLSSGLIANEAFQVGDIITIVKISSSYDGDVPSVVADGSGKTTWSIKQFIIDPTSTATIASVLGYSIVECTYNGVDYYGLSLVPNPSNFDAAVAIHSRNTAQGLKVSTQELILTSDTEDVYDNSQEDTYKEAVAASWKTAGAVDIQPEAILQGSIAYENGGGNAGFNLPVDTPVVYQQEIGPGETVPMGVLTGSGPWNFAITEGMLHANEDVPTLQIVPKSGFEDSKLTFNVNTKPSGAEFALDHTNDEIWCGFHNAGSTAIGNVDIDVLYDGQLVVNIKGKIVDN